MKLFNILLIGAAHVLAQKDKPCTGVDIVDDNYKLGDDVTCEQCSTLKTDNTKCYKKIKEACHVLCKVRVLFLLRLN